MQIGFSLSLYPPGGAGGVASVTATPAGAFAVGDTGTLTTLTLAEGDWPASDTYLLDGVTWTATRASAGVANLTASTPAFAAVPFGGSREITLQFETSTGAPVFATVTINAFAETTNSYIVFADTPRVRASATIAGSGEWVAAGLNATAARDALWAGTALGDLTLDTGSIVTPEADGGLVHDATAFSLADGAKTTQTWSVARKFTPDNVLATNGSNAFLYSNGFISALPTGVTFDYATGVLTKATTAGIVLVDISFYSTGAHHFTPGDTLTIDAALNVTTSGQFGVGVRGVGGAITYSTGGGNPTIATGAQSYAGTVVVPAIRNDSLVGHAIVLRMDAALQATINLAEMLAGAIAAVETVTATLIGDSDPASLEGAGTLNLAPLLASGEQISHYHLDPPAGAREIDGYSLAGFVAGASGAHIYVVDKYAGSEFTGGTLLDAMRAGGSNYNPDGLGGDTTHATNPSGPRLVIFNLPTDGVFDTGLGWSVRRSNIWINGHISNRPVVLTGSGLSVRGSNTVVEGIFWQGGEPPSTDASGRQIGWGVNPNSVLSAVDVLSDNEATQCAFFNGTDQTPSLYVASGTEKYIARATLSDSIVTHLYKAPNTTGVWSNFHEAEHNFGILVGGGNLDALIADTTFAGCIRRTPSIKRGVSIGLWSNFVVDTKFDTHPVQSTDSLDSPEAGVVAGVYPEGDTRKVSGFGNYFEPGEQKDNAAASNKLEYVPQWGSATTPATIYVRHSKIDPTLVAGDFNGSTLPTDFPILNEQTSATYTTIPAAPHLWAKRLPTHQDHTKQWNLDHGGPWPNARATMVPLWGTYTTAIEDHADVAYGARAKLYIDSSPATPALGTLGTQNLTTILSDFPASPYNTASNGLLNVVNWMHARRAALGGTPFGNVGRPCTAWVGGKLTITAAGSMTWDDADADADHAPLVVRIVGTQGTEIAVTIEAAP